MTTAALGGGGPARSPPPTASASPKGESTPFASSPHDEQRPSRCFSVPSLLSSTFRTLGPPPAVRARFVRHLLTDVRCLSSVLGLLRIEPTGASTSRDYSLEVDCFDLTRADPVLGNMLLRYPNTLMTVLEEAVVEAQRECLGRIGTMAGRLSDSFFIKGTRGIRVHARLVHLPPHPSCCRPSVSSLSSSDVGRVVQISGTVVRASSVQMYESVRAYRCSGKEGCGREFTVQADLEQSHNAIQRPTVCPNTGGGADGRTEPCSNSTFEMIPEGTVRTDYQEIKIQETPGWGSSRLNSGSRGRRGGCIPRSLLIKLQHDLVDRCQPGDEIVAVGSLISRWMPISTAGSGGGGGRWGGRGGGGGGGGAISKGGQGSGAKCEVTMALRASSIRVVHAEDHATWDAGANAYASSAAGGKSSGAVRDELRKEFDELWERTKERDAIGWKGEDAIGWGPMAARNFIVKAVCPRLYGMYIVKLGMLLTLIGGVNSDDRGAEIVADERARNVAAERQRRSNAPSSEIVEINEDGKDDVGDDESVDDDVIMPEQFHLGPTQNDSGSGGNGGGTTQGSSGSGGDYAPHNYRTIRSGAAVRTRRREQSHLLLVGDPGTGKSQFLRFAAALCPRSVLTTGTGTTSAGLTCAAVRDTSTGDFTLEAGALVLADRGVCCIDEFGCIREDERASVHEAMEQRTVSVAKAGIVCKLNSRATVVAVTNPRGGLYDDANTLQSNTGIGSPLLSRFDLIFKLVDSNDQERDDNIATYLLNRAIMGSGYDCADKTPASAASPNGKSGLGSPAGVSASGTDDVAPSAVWSMDKLRAYIASVKARFQPELTSDAATLLDRHYRRCRSTDSTTVARTVRLLESLIRLSQAHARLMYRGEVTLRDAAAAILLMECSASTLYGYNPRFSPTDDVEGSYGYGDGDDPILFRDPMTTPFPPEGHDDALFLCDAYRLLKRYDMLDRLTNEEREAARAHDPGLEPGCGSQAAEGGDDNQFGGGGSGPTQTQHSHRSSDWAGKEDPREVRGGAEGGRGGSRRGYYAVTPARQLRPEEDEEEGERDYYGRPLSSSTPSSTPRRYKRKKMGREPPQCRSPERQRRSTPSPSGWRSGMGSPVSENHRVGDTTPTPDECRGRDPQRMQSPDRRRYGGTHRDVAYAAGPEEGSGSGSGSSSPGKRSDARSDGDGGGGDDNGNDSQSRPASKSPYFSGSDEIVSPGRNASESSSQKKRRRRRAD